VNEKQESYVIQGKQLNEATVCDRILKLRNFKKKTLKTKTDKQKKIY
jgi:hypothetical protein